MDSLSGGEFKLDHHLTSMEAIYVFHAKIRYNIQKL